MYTNGRSVDRADIKNKTFEMFCRQNGVGTGIVNITDWKQNFKM